MLRCGKEWLIWLCLEYHSGNLQTHEKWTLVESRGQWRDEWSSFDVIVLDRNYQSKTAWVVWICLQLSRRNLSVRRKDISFDVDLLSLSPCRTYGIEPALIDVILDILINHLHNSSNDSLDVHTVRTIAQFMIERKNIIVPLLEFTLKCQPVELSTDWIP